MKFNFFLKKILVFSAFVFSFSNITFAQTFDPDLANKLQTALDSIQNANNIKGVSASVYIPNEGYWQGVAGASHSGVPITEDMQFGIGSNTKLFAAVSLLKLHENNTFSFDDSLYKWLPTSNYTNIDSNATIRQVLNQTTGFEDIINYPGFTDTVAADFNRQFPPSYLMTLVGTKLFPTGTDWSYSNTNYILAGLLAESISGKNFHDVLRDSILNPLSLDSTFLGFHETTSLTIAHPWQDGFDYSSIPRTSISTAAWAAGAMYSTSIEMVQWYQALFHDNFLNTPEFQEMTTFVGSGNYGFGIFEKVVNGRTIWLHGGEIVGYRSVTYFDTLSGTIISVLINQNPASPENIATEFLDLITTHTTGNSSDILGVKCKVYPNPTTDRIFVGLSENQVLQKLEVFDLNGKLLLTQNTNSLSIANLASGSYLLKVYTNNSIYNKKIMKN